jgi:EpsI family protein
MADHGTYGWVVFAVALVVFFAVARRLEWHAHVRGMAVADAVAASDHSGPVPTRARASSRAAAALAATVVAIAGPAAFGFLSMRQTTSAPPVRIPGVAGDGDWAAAPVSRPGADGSLDAGNAADPDRDSGAVGPRDAGWQPAFQGASERRVSRWMRDGVEVRVDRLIYDVQRQGAELVNSENRIAPDSLLLQAGIVGPLDSAARTVRQAAIRTEEGVRLVWFWYRVAGTDTPSPSRAKLRELLVFGRTAPPSELVAVSTPCGDADCDAATRALYRFVVGRDMPAAPPR